MDEKLKQEIIDWCKNSSSSRIYVGNVMKGNKGVSCKCTKNNNEIKVTDNKVRLNNKEYSYNKILIEDDLLIIKISEQEKIEINSKNFFKL